MKNLQLHLFMINIYFFFFTRKGITCLFMAAKIEEIYPPKLAEFAYVTDGACTDADLLDMEKILLMVSGMKLL